MKRWPKKKNCNSCVGHLSHPIIFRFHFHIRRGRSGPSFQPRVASPGSSPQQPPRKVSYAEAPEAPAKSIRRPSLKSNPAWYWNDIVFVLPLTRVFDDPSRASGSNSRFALWPLLCIGWITERWVVFCVVPTILAFDSFPIPPPPVLYFNIGGFRSKWVESQTNSKAYDFRF